MKLFEGRRHLNFGNMMTLVRRLTGVALVLVVMLTACRSVQRARAATHRRHRSSARATSCRSSVASE